MDDAPGLAERVAARLAEVPGVVAVALGGPRARGDARDDSDVDLGLFALNERHWMNEKRSVRLAASFPVVPAGFAAEAALAGEA